MLVEAHAVGAGDKQIITDQKLFRSYIYSGMFLQFNVG